MKVVIQRVSQASVEIDSEVVASIDQGLLILLGIVEGDTNEDISWLTNKIANLRIFNDNEEVMNESLLDKKLDCIVVSQFTLHAKTKKGNRPSYILAAKPDVAIPLYEQFLVELSQIIKKPVGSGQFGADMKVSLVNDGPVTIIIDSKNRV